MADVKENAMTGGVPARIRALDGAGNSISPTISEVTGAIPNVTESSKGLMSPIQAVVLDSMYYSLGVAGSFPVRFFRLGRFEIGHYVPIRISASYGGWNSNSRTNIDLIITNGGGSIIISGNGNNIIGYVSSDSYLDVYLRCSGGVSVVGSILGQFIAGRNTAEVEPAGITYIP